MAGWRYDYVSERLRYAYIRYGLPRLLPYAITPRYQLIATNVFHADAVTAAVIRSHVITITRCHEYAAAYAAERRDYQCHACHDTASQIHVMLRHATPPEVVITLPQMVIFVIAAADVTAAGCTLQAKMFTPCCAKAAPQQG